MNLEDLVPPLELCNNLPVGSFDNSVFGWRMSINYITGISEWNVVERSSGDVDCPAPTLAEIMFALVMLQDTDGKIHHPHLKWDHEAWTVDCYDRDYNVIEKRDVVNPATAALKLWLEIRKEAEK